MKTAEGRPLTDSALLQLLYLVRDCCNGPQAEQALLTRYGVSHAALVDMIDDARNMGARLERLETDLGARWVCSNAEALEASGLLARWIAAEEAKRGG